MDIISVQDMLNTMAYRGADGEPVPFSITFVTCNLSTDTGGEKITLDRAVLVGGSNSKSQARNPHHRTHFTRNIRHVDSDRIIKIHPPLVTKFNGFKVTL